MEFYLCRICGEIVTKSHFDSEEHIKRFNSVYDIEIKKSFKNDFISIKCQFFNTKYNYIYTDLYFKKHVKDIILKNIDDKKYYKSDVIKKICYILIIMQNNNIIQIYSIVIIL